MLVIEASNNIRSERYPQVLDLLSSVVEQFAVSADKTRFGALIYSDTALIRFNLTEYNSKQDVITAVQRLPFLGGRTRVANALRLMVSTGKCTKLMFCLDPLTVQTSRKVAQLTQKAIDRVTMTSLLRSLRSDASM